MSQRTYGEGIVTGIGLGMLLVSILWAVMVWP